MAIPHIPSYSIPELSELIENRVSWTLDPKRSALLIHDMQNYFLDKFTPNASPIKELVENIQRLKKVCQEWGIPVIYSAQPGGQTIEQRGLLQDFWGDGIGQDLDQMAIRQEIAPGDQDILLTKWRYSAFKRTNLLEILQKHERDQLIICGVYAHIGCLLTAADAYMQDIQPFFVADAVADFSLEEHKMAVRYAASRCAYTLTTEHALDLLQKEQSAPRHSLPMSLGEMRKQVAELIQEEPENISVDENLFHRGLDSVRMMVLVEKWRRAGAEITFARLAVRPFLSEWWELLSKASMIESLQDS
ncbi:MAG: isochorismatase [Bacillaceae bacterium]|uniref:isochorismatase family protein n=1 Tax=Aeribacillus TaxID=1055323 RepID=UPI0007B4F5C3|nr:MULTISPECIES: isochorismatase family protein [Aeribacillus]KZM56091.1 isochorismatase [Aeribacillus pallidus]MED0651572.1 isochorismatase family protein [Aeribacillus composti]MED4488276.1 isochorismatase family protein [Aeribacillus pallidus]REJ13862.1 MAG: isochorismatase [Bacillaceae bacterium]